MARKIFGSVNRIDQYKIIDKKGNVITYLGRKQYFRGKTTALYALIKLKKIFMDEDLKVEEN